MNRSTTSTSDRLGRLKAVIFDMDGVLIDTEPVWRRVETAVLAGVGIQISDAQLRETMGLRLEEVVQLWHRRQPWEAPSLTEVAEQIVGGVVAHVRERGSGMVGAVEAMQLVARQGLRSAIASSSNARLIDAVVERLEVRPLVDVVCSADSVMHGKPAPDVYLATAEQLQVAPGDCLAIEDSVNGLLAARAAGMTCVVVPEPAAAGDARFHAAQARMTSLLELTEERLASIAANYFW